MSKGRDTLSHIDGTHYELWVPATLGIKGEGTKPQQFDTSKVSPVLDMGQGGFAYEEEAGIISDASIVLAGLSGYNYAPGVSCCFGPGATPGSAPANERPNHARINRAMIEVVIANMASAALLSGRYMEYYFGLRNDAGAQLWLEAGHLYGSSQLQRYYAEIDETILVHPGHEFEMRIALQVDWSGGAGPATFPAGTVANFYTQSYKKPLGGQLPI